MTPDEQLADLLVKRQTALTESRRAGDGGARLAARERFFDFDEQAHKVAREIREARR